MFLTLPLLQHSANIRLTIIVIVFDLFVLKIWCKRSKMLRQKVLKHNYFDQMLNSTDYTEKSY